MNSVANTIFQQLGGNEFAVMVGVKSLTQTENSLTVKFSGGKYFTVTLNGKDLYDIHYFTMRKGKVITKDKAFDVYCDSLRGFFENMTGFRTSLRYVYS